MHYFDWRHILSLLAIIALTLALYFPLKKRSERAKKIAIGCIIGLNLFQHLFKFLVWPHMWGTGFALENTAYNACAFLILFAPFAVFGKNKLFRQYFAYVATCAGAVASLFPVWFVGKSLLTWEFVRFWFCHALLFLSGLLPALFGFVPFRWKDGWKFGLLFLLMLCLLLVNNVVFLIACEGVTGDALYERLLVQSPLWLMGPSDEGNLAAKILSALTLPIFRGGAGKPYTPILWYALPVYLAATALGYGFGGLTVLIAHLKKAKNAEDTQRSIEAPAVPPEEAPETQEEKPSEET